MCHVSELVPREWNQSAAKAVNASQRKKMKPGSQLLQISKFVIALAVASQMAQWSAVAADKSTTPVSKKDVSFIHDAAQGGMAEIRMGEIGQQRGQSSDVKALSQKLITDHKKAN